jgi:DNA repair protein RecN (Recombination protein N)
VINKGKDLSKGEDVSKEAKPILSAISIKNLGVIEEAYLEFSPGFSVLTGETGAGKTMILSALNLISGARSDTDLIRIGTDRLSVSATLTLPSNSANSDLVEILDEFLLEQEEGEILLARALNRDGKSRASVGSESVTASMLTKLTSRLFQIHGQSTNHEILDKGRQLDLLDGFDDHIRTSLAEYQEVFEEYKQVLKLIVEMEEKEKNRDREIAKLEEFLVSARRILLKRDESENVKNLIARVDSSEKWISAFQKASEHLQESALSSIIEAEKALHPLASNEEVRRLLERLSAIEIETLDIAGELVKSLHLSDLDSISVDELRSRLADINGFIKRFSHLLPNSIAEEEKGNALIDIQVAFENELRLLTSGERGKAEILERKNLIEERLSKSVLQLSEYRSKAAKKAAQAILVELRDLGLSDSLFEIRVKSSSSLTDLTRDGGDEVSFLFSSHVSNNLLPIGKGISGGELSRLMLAIELVLSRSRKVGTLIFDEIDVGVGGETALVIGERLQRLSESFQIIVVTHLAQVAAWADHHFVIEKSVDGRFVSSSVRLVTGEDRAIEVARMLSGQSELSVAREHAKELLKHANKISGA